MRQNVVSEVRMNGRIKRVGDQTAFDPSSAPLNPVAAAREVLTFPKYRASPKPESDGWNVTYPGRNLRVLRVGSSKPSMLNGFSDMVDGGRIIQGLAPALDMTPTYSGILEIVYSL